MILAQEPYRKLFPEPAGERFVAVDWPRVASVPRTQIDLNSIAALSPDGKSLAVCEVEHGKEQRYFVKLFAVEEQQPQHRFQVKGSTREMCFSPDGTGLLTATQGGFEEVKAGSQVGYLPRPGKARVWDVSSGEVLFDLDEHRLTLQQQNAVFSPDGQWIAAANGDRTVLVWNARNGTLHRKLTADSQMLTVAFSPEGDLLMAGGSGRLVVWETEGWKLHRTLTLEKAFVRRILVHPDGKHLTLLVDPVGKQVDEVQTLELGTGKVLSRFSADLASAVMADGGSKLVHLHPDRKLVVVRELLTGRVHRILLSPSGYAVDLLPQGDDVLLTGPTPADRNVTGVWRMPR